MKRRDVIKLFTLSPAALAGGSVWAAALDDEYLRNPEAGSLPLAIQYTTKVREMLTWIRSNQMENLMESAYAIARTVKNGGRCWSNWDMGHNFNYDNFL